MSATSPLAPAVLAGRVFPGFGSTVGVWVTDPAALPIAEDILRRQVAAVDRACSRFRADSDLSRANAAAGHAVRVSDLLLEAVDVAVEMARWSDGRCDPTVGGAVLAAGYDRDIARIEADGPGRLLPAAPAGSWQAIRVDHGAGELTVPAGAALDLGGCAKGWTADRAVAEIAETVVPGVGVCVSAGGDIAVAGPAPDGGWPVRVSHSLAASAGVGDDDLSLHTGAVATSGAVRRAWFIDGQAFHHLVDPRTGRPGVEHWRLATVFAPRCVVADAAAKVAWLMGDAAPAWLAERGLAARLAHRSGAVTRVVPA